MSTLTVTAEQLEQSQKALQRLVANPNVPIPAALHLARLLKKLDPEISTINERRGVINENHTLLDADGNKIPALDAEGKVIPDRYQVKDPAKFAEDMTSLMTAPIAIAMPPLKAESMGSVCVAPADMLVLDWLFQA